MHDVIVSTRSSQAGLTSCLSRGVAYSLDSMRMRSTLLATLSL